MARPVSTPSGPSPARARREGLVAAILLSGGCAALVALATAAGCSYDRPSEGDVIFKETGTADVGDAQVFEVGDDAVASRDKLCGELDLGTCDPDRGEICTHLDAGLDAGLDGGGDSATPDGAPDGDAPEGGTLPPDAAFDAPYDAFGSGTTNACRVVKEANKAKTACAPAGVLLLDAICAIDADCAPGLACVGAISPRCLPYCCGGTPELDPCHASGRYCTPLPLAERPSDKVPVCVTPDNCTLLDNSGDICPKDVTTCTVVTKYGDTSCVPAAPLGSGLDLACCDETHPCALFYACLGPTGARACRKLCHEGRDEECTRGVCQKASTIPAGFGLCSVGDAGSLDGGCKGGS